MKQIIIYYNLHIIMTDGDILEVHVNAGIARLYPDVVTAPLRAGEGVVIPPEVIPPHGGRLGVSRALAVR